MIKTRDVNKIMRLMGLTIMQASKNFKSKMMLRIFGKIVWYFKKICETHEQLGKSGYSISARNYS